MLGYISRILIVLIFTSFLAGQKAFATRISDIVLGEEDRVCWMIPGGMRGVFDCFVGMIDEQDSSLNDLVEYLDSLLVGAGGDRSLLQAAQVSWKQSVDATCSGLYEKRYEGGSLARTEPLRCRFLMRKSRDRLLGIIEVSRDYLAYGEPYFNLYDYEKICWTPLGWSQKTRCLENRLHDAQQSLKSLGKILHDTYKDHENDWFIMAFKRAEEAFENDVE